MDTKSLIEADVEDIIPTTPAQACVCCCCCVVNIVLLILFFPCTMTQLGQFKSGLIRNTVTGYVDMKTDYGPGRYWLGFWKEFIEFPTTLNTIEFSNDVPEKGVVQLHPLRSRDKDGKLVFLDISVQYRLDRKNIGKIYELMLTSYEEVFIAELRDQFAKAANLFEIKEAWTNYDTITDLMRVRCEAVLKERYAECWGLQLWGVTLSQRFEDKLITTQVKKQAQKTQENAKVQNMVRARTKVLLAEYKKNITILEAKGAADAFLIQKEAVALGGARRIRAQATAMNIVKERICPGTVRVYDSDVKLHSDDTDRYTCPEMYKMNNSQVIHYQTQMLLRSLNHSNIAYKMSSGAASQAINLEAQRKILKGRARRLLLQDSGYERNGDARKLIKQSGYSNSGHAPEKDHRRLLLKASGWHPPAMVKNQDATNKALLDLDGEDEAQDLHEL
jgi:hypothetical protein